MTDTAAEEREVAERERRLADSEWAHMARHDKNEHLYYRAMKMHERAAEVHDAIADLTPND